MCVVCFVRIDFVGGWVEGQSSVCVRVLVCAWCVRALITSQCDTVLLTDRSMESDLLLAALGTTFILECKIFIPRCSKINFIYFEKVFSCVVYLGLNWPSSRT